MRRCALLGRGGLALGNWLRCLEISNGAELTGSRVHISNLSQTSVRRSLASGVPKEDICPHVQSSSFLNHQPQSSLHLPIRECSQHI